MYFIIFHILFFIKYNEYVKDYTLQITLTIMLLTNNKIYLYIVKLYNLLLNKAIF